MGWATLKGLRKSMMLMLVEQTDRNPVDVPLVARGHFDDSKYLERKLNHIPNHLQFVGRPHLANILV